MSGGTKAKYISETVGKNLHSLGVSYKVAAVDSLSEGKSPQGEFMKLVRQYNSRIVEDTLRYLYGTVRSGHFHKGVFPLGEFEPLRFGVLPGPEYQQRAQRVEVASFIQNVLIDWLVDHAK